MLGDIYVQSVSEKLNNGQLHGRFKLLSEQSSSKYYLDFGAGGLLGEQAENYFMLPQAYAGFQMEERVRLTFGRMIKTYSSLDDYWMLGDVQPLFRWDAVRPELQGLTGLFIEMDAHKNFKLDLFMSYLYLPTQGPSFSTVNGKLTSGNPWFTSPVNVLSLSGQAYDLIYTVNTPDVADIILQPSFGASTTLQSDSESFWLRMGYFMKTRNELALPFQSTLNLGNNTGDISIFPQVAQHKLATLDFGYKSDKWAFTLSGIHESDITFDTQSLWFYPEFSDQYKVGANLMFKVTPFHTIELGGLKTFDNTIIVRGPVTTQLSVYTFRNQYDDAADLRWTAVFMPRAHGFLFQTKARYAYDYEAETSLISLELNYKPTAEFTCFLRNDFFGGKETTDTSDYNNLLVNYLDKDRIQAGVKYVF